MNDIGTESFGWLPGNPLSRFLSFYFLAEGSQFSILYQVELPLPSPPAAEEGETSLHSPQPLNTTTCSVPLPSHPEAHR